jgi:hypothetical protein
MSSPHNRNVGRGVSSRRSAQLPAFCRSRRPTVTVLVSSLSSLRFLVLVGLAVQLSTLLLVIAGPVPPRPKVSTSTVSRFESGTAGGGAAPVTPLAER